MFDEKQLSEMIDACHLTKLAPVVVGVSGGADSLALLWVLRRLGYPVIVAHFNHQLREEAGQDEVFVSAVAQKYGLPFVAGRGPVSDFATRQHQSIEEAARNLRYAYLFSVARENNAQAVAVGHTADDQVETVLMHFLRGTGLNGLKGMDYRAVNPLWSESIPLVRPLLGLWHADTLAITNAEGFTPVTDLTNADLAYRRNRLRHELIPVLEQYNPKFREAIWRTAFTLGADFDFLEQTAGDVWQDLILSKDDNGVVLRRQGFLNASVAIQRQLLRKAIASLSTLQDIDLETIERARTFIQSPSRSRRIDLASRLNVAVDAGRVFIFPWGQRLPGISGPAVSDVSCIELPVPGKIALSGDWWIEALIEPAQDACVQDNPDEASLDFDQILHPLVVRARKPGDRWQPLGMTRGTQKLSDFLVNEKVEASLREGWPLVCAGEEIVWVSGYRIGHRFRVTPQSRRILRLRLSRELP